MNSEPRPSEAISDEELLVIYQAQLKYVCEENHEDDQSIMRVISGFRADLVQKGYDNYTIEELVDELISSL